MSEVKVSETDALALLGAAVMKPFDKLDWEAFAGCETLEPKIGTVGKFTIILDGSMINILNQDEDGNEHVFELTKVSA